jgi:hypothetical protein
MGFPTNTNIPDTGGARTEHPITGPTSGNSGRYTWTGPIQTSANQTWLTGGQIVYDGTATNTESK